MRPISKAALYLGIILALAAGILFWLGGKTRKYRVETTIQAPTTEVFKHITDPALIPQWAEGVVKIQPLSDGKSQPGSRAKITYQKDGQEIELTDEIKTIEENSRLVVASTGSVFRVSSDYSLMENGATQTKLRVEVHLNYRGIYRFIGPFLSNKENETRLESDIQKLRANVESSFDPTTYKPPITADSKNDANKKGDQQKKADNNSENTPQKSSDG